MELDTERLETVAERIAEAGLADRRRRMSRHEFSDLHGITPENVAEHERTIVAVIIQARPRGVADEEYETLADKVMAADVTSAPDHETAFEQLLEIDMVGQKIANELLRHLVDVFELPGTEEWREDLHVALDRHVLAALSKTGALRIPDDRTPERAVNLDPEASPRKLISYDEVQTAMGEAASAAGLARIELDELWIQNREFLSDPLLREESELLELVEETQ